MYSASGTYPFSTQVHKIDPYKGHFSYFHRGSLMSINNCRGIYPVHNTNPYKGHFPPLSQGQSTCQLLIAGAYPVHMTVAVKMEEVSFIRAFSSPRDGVAPRG